MKKILAAILVLSIGVVILCTYQKQAIPVAEYPLHADMIAEALQTWGFSCTMEEDEWVKEMRQEQPMREGDSQWETRIGG